MAITATLYSVAKYPNSTAQPSGGVSYNVTLKDACSIVNPVLLFDFGTGGNPTGYNYLQLPVFDNRYYWIDDWTYERGVWEASCRVDPLASWKGDIGASTQYIVRSSARYNGDLVDSRYPLTSNITTSELHFDNPLAVTAQAFGCYVLGVINNDNSYVGGGVSYYYLTQTQFDAFKKFLLTDVNYLNIDTEEISQSLSKALLNPYQYVVSCKWFPLLPTTGGAVTAIPFGWWSAPVSARYLPADSVSKHYAVTGMVLPQHPQAASRGNYCNAAPATTRELIIEPFGTIPLDATLLANFASISGVVSVDFVTGQARLILNGTRGNSTKRILTTYTNIAVDIQLSQISTEIPSSTGEIIGTGLKAAVGGIVGAVSDLFGQGSTTPSSVTGAAQMAISQSATRGSQGSFLYYMGGSSSDIVLLSHFQLYADDDNADRGRPLFARHRVSELPGFLICADPNISTHATSSEIRQIESAMSSGFFYE